METQKIIFSVLNEVKDKLPIEKFNWAREYVEVGECGLALEVLVEYIIEFEIKISLESRSLLIDCGNSMRMDIASILLL